MPRILFLTYYFYPCNGTASNRPNSFVRNLNLNNFQVTVITRHWTGEERVWAEYLGSNVQPVKINRDKPNLEIHYLPFRAFRYPLFTWLTTTWQNLMGNFNYELPYGQFFGYAHHHLSSNQYDYILISTPPLTALKMGAQLARLHSIPLIVDVRDFENDILLYRKKQHSWLRQKQHDLLMVYLKKWMAHAPLIFTASPPLTEYLGEAIQKEVFTLNNGFEQELLQMNEKQEDRYFTITVTGTLYEMANLDVMIQTCRIIFERNPKIAMRFQFIGLLSNQAVASLFQKVIPEENLVLTHRIPQEHAMKKASASHVLMLAGFDEMKGAYTTKIFEYLGLRRNILQIPGDRDVVEELIMKTHSGLAPHTSEEAYAIIMNWYNEWKNKGTILYEGDLDRILEFTRENQFNKLLNRLAAPSSVR